MHEQLRKLQSSMMTPWLQHGQEFINFFRHGKNIRNFYREIAFQREKKHKKYPDTLQTINRVRLRPGKAPLLIIRCILQLLHFKLIGLSSWGQVALLYMFLMLGLTIGLTETQLIDHTTAVNTSDVFKTIDLYSDSESRTKTLFQSFIGSTESTELFQQSILSERDDNFMSSKMLLSSYHVMSSLTENLEVSVISHSVHIDNNPETVSDTTTATVQSFPIQLPDTKVENNLMTSYYTSYNWNQPRMDLETRKASAEFELFYDSLPDKNTESSLLLTYYTTQSENQLKNLIQTSEATEILPPFTDSLSYTSEESRLVVKYHTVQNNKQSQKDHTEKTKISVPFTSFQASSPTSFQDSLVTSYHTTRPHNGPEVITETSTSTDKLSTFNNSLSKGNEEGDLMTNYFTPQPDNEAEAKPETRKASENFPPSTSSLPKENEESSLMTSYLILQPDNQPESRSETRKVSEQFSTLISSLTFEKEEGSLVTIYPATQKLNEPEKDIETSTTSEQLAPLTDSLLSDVQSLLMTSYFTARYDYQPETRSETNKPSETNPSSFTDEESISRTSYQTKQNYNMLQMDFESGKAPILFIPFTYSFLDSNVQSTLGQSYGTALNGIEIEIEPTSTISVQPTSFANSLVHSSSEGSLGTNYHKIPNNKQLFTVSESVKQSLHFTSFYDSLNFNNAQSSLRTSFHTVQPYNQLNTVSETSEKSKEVSQSTTLFPYKTVDSGVKTSYYSTQNGNQMKTDSRIRTSLIQYESYTNSLPQINEEIIFSTSYYITTKTIASTASTQYLTFLSSRHFSNVEDNLGTPYYTIQIVEQLERDTETIPASIDFLPSSFSSPSRNVDSSLKITDDTTNGINQSEKYAEQSQASEKLTILTDSSQYSTYSTAQGNFRSSYYTTQYKNLPETHLEEMNRASVLLNSFTNVSLHGMVDRNLRTNFYSTEYDEQAETILETLKTPIQSTAFVDFLSNVKSRLKPVSSTPSFDAINSKFVQSSTEIILHTTSTGTIQLQELSSHAISTNLNEEIVTGTLNLELDIKPTNSFKVPEGTSKAFHSQPKNSETLQTVTTAELQSMTAHFLTTFLGKAEIASVDTASTLTSSPTLKSASAETDVQFMPTSERGSLAQSIISDQANELYTSYVSSNVVVSSTSTLKLDFLNSNKALVSWDETTILATEISNAAVLLSSLQPAAIDSSNYDLSAILQQVTDSGGSKIVLHSEKVMFVSEYGSEHQTKFLRSSLSTAILPDTPLSIKTTKTFSSSSENSGLFSETPPQGDRIEGQASASSVTKTTRLLSLPEIENNHTPSSSQKTTTVPPPINIDVSILDSTLQISSETFDLTTWSYSKYKNQDVTQSPELSFDQHRSKSSVHDSALSVESSSITTRRTSFSPSFTQSLSLISPTQSASAVVENFNTGISSHWNILTQEGSTQIPVLSTSFYMDQQLFTQISLLGDALDSSFHNLAFDTFSTHSFELEYTNDYKSQENLKGNVLFSSRLPASSKRENVDSTYSHMSLGVTDRYNNYENLVISKIMANTPSVRSIGTEIDSQAVQINPTKTIQSTQAGLNDEIVLDTSIATTEHDTVSSRTQLQYFSEVSKVKTITSGMTTLKSTISFEGHDVIRTTTPLSVQAILSPGLNLDKISTSKSLTSTAPKATGATYSSKASNSQNLYEKSEQMLSTNANVIIFQSSSHKPEKLLSSQSFIYFVNDVINSTGNINHLDSVSSTPILHFMSSTSLSEMPKSLLNDINVPSVSISSAIRHGNEESRVFTHSELVQSLQAYENQGHSLNRDFSVINEISKSPSTKYPSTDHLSLKKNEDVYIVSLTTIPNGMPVGRSASLENDVSSSTSYLSRATAIDPKSSTIFVSNVPSQVLDATSVSESVSVSETFNNDIFLQATKIKQEEKFTSNTGLVFDTEIDDAFFRHSEQITTSFSMITPVTFTAQTPETEALSQGKFFYPIKETHFVSDFTSLELVTSYSDLDMNNTDMDPPLKSISVSIDANQLGDLSISSSFGSVQPWGHQINDRSSHDNDRTTLFTLQIPRTTTEINLPETNGTSKETIHNLEKFSLIHSESVLNTSSLLIKSESSSKDVDYSKISYGQIQFSTESTTSFYLQKSGHLTTKTSYVEKDIFSSFHRNSLDYSEERLSIFQQTKQNSMETYTSIIVTEPMVIHSDKLTFEASLLAPSLSIKLSAFKQTEYFSTSSELFQIQSTLEEPQTDASKSYTDFLAPRNSMLGLLMSSEDSSLQSNIATNNKLGSQSVQSFPSVATVTTVENLSTEIMKPDKVTDESVLSLLDISFYSETVPVQSTNMLQEDSWQQGNVSNHITNLNNSTLFHVRTSHTPLSLDANAIKGDITRTSLEHIQENSSKYTRITLHLYSISSKGDDSAMNSPTLHVTPTEIIDSTNLPTYAITTEIEWSGIETRFIEKATLSDKTADTDVSNFHSVQPSDRLMLDTILTATTLSHNNFFTTDKVTTLLRADSVNSERNFEEIMMTSSSYLSMFPLHSVNTGSYTAAISHSPTSIISELSNSTEKSYYSGIIFSTPTNHIKSISNREGTWSESSATGISLKRDAPYSMSASLGKDESFASNSGRAFSVDTAAFTFSTHVKKENSQESVRLNQFISPLLSSFSLMLQPTSSLPQHKSSSVIDDTVSGLRKNQSQDVAATKSSALIQSPASLLNSGVHDNSYRSELHIETISDEDTVQSTVVYDRKHVKSGTTKSFQFMEMYWSSSVFFKNDIGKAFSTTNDPFTISKILEIKGWPFQDKAKTISVNTEFNSVTPSSMGSSLSDVADFMTKKLYVQDKPLYTSSEFVESRTSSNMKTHIESDAFFTTNDISILPEEGSQPSLFPSTLSYKLHKIETNSKSSFFLAAIGSSRIISSPIITKNTWESLMVSQSDHIIQPTQPKNVQTSFSFVPLLETLVRKTTSKLTNGLYAESGFGSETSLITESEIREFLEAHSSSTSRYFWKTGTPLITSLFKPISPAVQSSSVNKDSLSMALENTPDHSAELGITLPYNQLFSSNNKEQPYMTNEIPFSPKSWKTVAIHSSFESTFTHAADNILIPDSVSTSLQMEQSSTFSDKNSFLFTADTIHVKTATIQSISSRREKNNSSPTLVLALSPSRVEREPPSTDSDDSIPHGTSSSSEVHGIYLKSEAHNKLLESENFINDYALTTTNKPSTEAGLSTSFVFRLPLQSFSNERQASYADGLMSLPYFATLQNEETTSEEKTLPSVNQQSSLISAALDRQIVTLNPAIDLQASGWEKQSSVSAGIWYSSNDVVSFQKSDTIIKKQSLTPRQYSSALFPSFHSLIPKTEADHSSEPISRTAINLLADSQLDFYSSTVIEDIPDTHDTSETSTILLQDSEIGPSSFVLAMRDEHEYDLDTSLQTSVTSQSFLSSAFYDDISPSKFLSNSVTRYSLTAEQENNMISPSTEPSTKTLQRSSLSRSNDLLQKTFPPIIPFTITNLYETSSFFETGSVGNRQGIRTSSQFSFGYFTSSPNINELFQDLKTKDVSTGGSQTQAFSFADDRIISPNSEGSLSNKLSYEEKYSIKEKANTVQVLDVSWFSSSQYSSILSGNTIQSDVYSINDGFTFRETQDLLQSKSTDDKISLKVSDTVSSELFINSQTIDNVPAVSSNTDSYSQTFAISSTPHIILSASEHKESSMSLQPSYYTASETYIVNPYLSLTSTTKEPKTYDLSFTTFKKHMETEPLATNSQDFELLYNSEAHVPKFSQTGSDTGLYETSASATVDKTQAKLSATLESSTTKVDGHISEKISISSSSLASYTEDQTSAKSSTTLKVSAKHSVSTLSSDLVSSFETDTLDSEIMDNSKFFISKTSKHIETANSSLETSYFKERDSISDGETFMTQTSSLKYHKSSVSVNISSSSEDTIWESIIVQSETRAETSLGKSFTESPEKSSEQSLISIPLPRTVSLSTEISTLAFEEGGISSSYSTGGISSSYSTYAGTSFPSVTVVSKSSNMERPPVKSSTLFQKTVYNSSETFRTSFSFNDSTVPSISTSVFSSDTKSSSDYHRIIASSQTLARSSDYAMNDVSTISTSAWPTRTSVFIASSTVVLIASTSIIPSPSVVNSSTLLTIKIQLKQSVDLTDTDLREELEKGLQVCYVEGVNKMKSVIGRKKRQDETTNGIQVQVDSLTRDPSEPTNVDVQFYVLDDGEPVSATVAEDTLNQLSLVEMSAYLAYPVITRARPVIQTSAPEEPDDNATFPVLIVILVVASVVSAIFIILVVYFCRRKKQDRPLSLKTSFVSSLSLKKPTLDEMDLMVDMEKGEVVSRKSNNSTLAVKPSTVDTNTINRMFQQLQKTGAEIDSPLRLNDVSYFQRSLSEMCSPHARLERLRRLGLNVTEVGNARSLYKINEARAHLGNGIEVKEESIKQTTKVKDERGRREKKQDLTPYSSLQNSASVACQCDNSQTISEDQNLIQADQEEKLWHSVTFMANEGYLSDSSYRSPTIDKTKADIENATGNAIRHIKQANIPSKENHSRKNHHKKPPDGGSNTQRGKRTEDVRDSRLDHSVNRGKYHASFEKYKTEFLGTPLTTSTQVKQKQKEPLNIYRGVKSDSETDTDSVFLPSIQDSEIASVSVFDDDIDIVNDQYYDSELYTDMDEFQETKGMFDTLDYETVIPEKGYTKHRHQEAPVEAMNDIMYQYLKPMDQLYFIKGLNQYPDGSEYAGHEFDSVNFSSNYKTAKARKQYKHLGRRREGRNMAEGLMQYPEAGDPSALEHVTKMGRVSSRGLSGGRSCRPQFRDIPYHPPVVFPSRESPIQITEPIKEPENILDTECDKKENNGQQGNVQSKCTENHYIENDYGNGPNAESFTVVEGKTLELQPQQIPERPEHTAFTPFVPQPYEEMKLGRNMRAVPRGRIGAATMTQLDSDANEPLLAANPPPNLVVDYLSNTSSPLTAQTYNLNSRPTPNQPSVRSIASPQHPSQDLIEMLHRNQSMSISRLDEQQRIAEERRREDENKTEEDRWQQERRAEGMERQRQAEEMEKLERERKEEMWKKQEEIRKERERREEEYRLEIERKNREEMEQRNREETDRRNREENERRNREERERMERNAADFQHKQDIQTRNELLEDAFALSSVPSLGRDLYTAKDLRRPERSTDQGSSLPFSPHSGSLNYETGTGGSSSSTAQKTDTFHGKDGESKSFGKQETVDEVQDIEEDIEVEQASDSDDQFNF